MNKEATYMSKPKKMCIVCHRRPPTVPDRERLGRPIKRVCSECHGERLRLDLELSLRRRKESQE